MKPRCHIVKIALCCCFVEKFFWLFKHKKVRDFGKEANICVSIIGALHMAYIVVYLIAGYVTTSMIV